MKKKQNDRIQQFINYTVVIVLAIVCAFSYFQQQKDLQVSGITLCKVIKKYRKPGAGFFRGKEALIEYYLSGKRYEGTVWNSSDIYNVGDCFWLEYSVNNPKTFNVLWDKGKQNCNCLK